MRERDGVVRVVDVRGTRIDAEGQRWHHVYQPVSKDPSAALVGAEWRSGDSAAAEAAKDGFIDALAKSDRKNLDGVRSKLGCDGCHTLDRLPNTRPGEHGIVARGTDGAGFFTPSTLLADAAPLEVYGVDPNPGAPFTTITCADGNPPEIRAKRVRCASGVPTAHVDVAAAAEAGDPHALAVVASREHLLGGADRVAVLSEGAP